MFISPFEKTDRHKFVLSHYNELHIKSLLKFVKNIFIMKNLCKIVKRSLSVFLHSNEQYLTEEDNNDTKYLLTSLNLNSFHTTDKNTKVEWCKQCKICHRVTVSDVPNMRCIFRSPKPTVNFFGFCPKKIYFWKKINLHSFKSKYFTPIKI